MISCFYIETRWRVGSARSDTSGVWVNEWVNEWQEQEWVCEWKNEWTLEDEDTSEWIK